MVSQFYHKLSITVVALVALLQFTSFATTPKSLPEERTRQMEEQACREPASGGSTCPYEDLLNHRSGFANDVTGGTGGEVVVIDSLNYEDLRDALESDGPKWIRFKPGLKGEIEIEGHLYIKSDKTIDGRGADITLTSPDDCDGIRFWGREKRNHGIEVDRSNLIVHNIKIIRVGSGNNCGQGIGVAFGARNVWIDHVTFSHNGDESVSTGKGATDLTVSWCRFVDTDKGILLSWGDKGDDALDGVIRATIHHNYFLRVNGRSPALTYGKTHYFNNYNKHWNWGAVHSSMGAEVYSENNIYGGGRWDNSPPAIDTTSNRWRPKPGYAKTVGDVFLNVPDDIDARGPGINTGRVFDPGEFYEYKAEPADDKLKDNLEKYAGWSEDPQWSDAQSTPLE